MTNPSSIINRSVSRTTTRPAARPPLHPLQKATYITVLAFIVFVTLHMIALDSALWEASQQLQELREDLRSPYGLDLPEPVPWEADPVKWRETNCVLYPTHPAC